MEELEQVCAEEADLDRKQRDQDGERQRQRPAPDEAEHGEGEQGIDHHRAGDGNPVGVRQRRELPKSTTSAITAARSSQLTRGM